MGYIILLWHSLSLPYNYLESDQHLYCMLQESIKNLVSVPKNLKTQIVCVEVHAGLNLPWSENLITIFLEIRPIYCLMFVLENYIHNQLFK